MAFERQTWQTLIYHRAVLQKFLLGAFSFSKSADHPNPSRYQIRLDQCIDHRTATWPRWFCSSASTKQKMWSVHCISALKSRNAYRHLFGDTTDSCLPNLLRFGLKISPRLLLWCRYTSQRLCLSQSSLELFDV